MNGSDTGQIVALFLLAVVSSGSVAQDLDELERRLQHAKQAELSKESARKREAEAFEARQREAATAAAAEARAAEERTRLDKEAALSASTVCTDASVIAAQPVEYPQAARRRRLEGTVLISLHIHASGMVSNAMVEKSSGHRELDHGALLYARSLRIAPAIACSGQPVESTVTVPVSFNLND